MDRKDWFIDFAKIAGRKNLRKYFISVTKSILSEHCDEVKKENGIRNAIDSLDVAFNDESLPWDVIDAKKPSAPTESHKEISQFYCTIDFGQMLGI